MKIRQAVEQDIEPISEIYRACFPREQQHSKWIEACFRSYPKGVYFVIESEGVVVGYILWCIKNGFRENAIVELEQVGIHPENSGMGFGKVLVKESYEIFKTFVADLGLNIGAVLVTTSEGNYAESMYKSVLGVETSAKIEGYGSGNELILFKKYESAG